MTIELHPSAATADTSDYTKRRNFAEAEFPMLDLSKAIGMTAVPNPAEEMQSLSLDELIELASKKFLVPEGEL